MDNLHSYGNLANLTFARTILILLHSIQKEKLYDVVIKIIFLIAKCLFLDKGCLINLIPFIIDFHSFNSFHYGVTEIYFQKEFVEYACAG